MTMCRFETGCLFRTPSNLFKTVSLKKLNKIRRDAYANFPFLPYSAFLTFFFLNLNFFNHIKINLFYK